MAKKCPAGCRRSCATSSSTRGYSPWTDHNKLAGGFEFTKKQGTIISVLYAFASGMMSTVIPNEARAVYYSKGGQFFKDRIAKTAKLGYDIGTVNAYAPDGQMTVTCVKTRMIHAAVRHLLPQSPHWPKQYVPISQDDLMVTWHSLPTTIMANLTKWGSLRVAMNHRATCTPGRCAGTFSGSGTSTCRRRGGRRTCSPHRC